MRSIGKVNIKKLNKIIEQEYKAKQDANRVFGMNMNYLGLESKIKARIPEEWYDIWESAHNEINRLIDDKINDLIHT